ncbi:hypothetical protein Tco_0105453 [Tanacetum coccineum]
MYLFIEQEIWQTATASTLEDGDMGITATIDGKVKGQTLQGEGSTIPVESHHTPTSAPSTSQPPTSSPSMPTTNVTEVAASMPHDSPLPRVYSLRSDEGSLTLNELTVKKLEHKVKLIKARRKVRLVISDNEDDLEDPSKQGRKISQINKDEGITLQLREGVSTARATPEGVSTAKSIPEAISTAEPYMDVTLAEALVDLLKSGKKKSPKPKARDDKDKDSKKKAGGIRKKTLARKRAGEKKSEENAKRQKMEDDAEKEELRAHLDIIPGVVMCCNVESLATKLFDSCGIHVLLIDTGIAIHMLVEKTYPLTQEMLSRILSRKLEVDNESEMAFELLRFTRSQIEK